MIAYDLLLVIFALFGVILTLSKHDYLIISGDIVVSFCALVYLIMFIFQCVWNRKKENKDE